MPQLHANLSKSSSVPSVSGGILWADELNKVFYLYGGEYQTNPEGFNLWAYDTINNTWYTAGPTNSIQRVAWGAGVAVQEIGAGFYLGGWLNENTVPGWRGIPVATNALIRYDFDTQQWTNSTGPDENGRAEGIMVYMPVSDGGLLISFGGVLDPYRNGTVVGDALSTIHIYDIRSGNWYVQTATGDIPEMRRSFCGGVTWADDKSSWNVYIYGGFGMPDNSTGYDDVYILSMPSFTWTKWYPTDAGEGNPHGMLSCNVVDGAQMLIIGGHFVQHERCDAMNIWGTHNLNLGKTGPEGAKWEAYYPNITEYRVPSEVIAKIGGRPDGGATVTEPTSGWGNRDLPVYFARKEPIFDARTPTRPIPGPTATNNSTAGTGSRSNTAAIAGGAVGGGVALILLIALILYCLRRKKKSTKPSELPPNTVHELATPVIVEPKSAFPHAQGPAPHDVRTDSEASAAAPYGTPLGARPYSPTQPSPHSPYASQLQNPYSATPLSPLSAHTPQYISPVMAQPAQFQYAQPYDPTQHPSHLMHYPPPQPPEPSPSPTTYTDSHPESTEQTPAHFYPQPLKTRQASNELPLVGDSPPPMRGRFREED
ncbi:hypothetical protein W97_01928 [Coniosporium apollinis CBS 100218]|uniref:Kelch repeat protein n=1 Tax=Coniosporium apollinis (strain CBS 100218) TaxID=1168221 RepID=R7YLM0_CONA1|nr:uncharacterized protein W97_01928 [Coniosporium apollinis CBS 100218]EON62704.1 hypothetical protein W97_01928 [Coniosporium apollinis CBS 100218]